MDDETPRAAAPKRVALNMKATPALRARIDAAAASTGLSVAQEVERRLIASMDNDDRHGGAHNAAFIGLFSSIIQLAEQRSGHRWSQDYTTWVAVRDATLAVLGASKPTPPGAVEARKAADAYASELENWNAPNPSLGLPRLPKGKSPLTDFGTDLERYDQISSELSNAAAVPNAAHVAGAELGTAIASELLSPERRK